MNLPRVIFPVLPVSTSWNCTASAAAKDVDEVSRLFIRRVPTPAPGRHPTRAHSSAVKDEIPPAHNAEDGVGLGLSPVAVGASRQPLYIIKTSNRGER